MSGSSMDLKCALGGALTGSIINCCLLGVVTVQTYGSSNAQIARTAVWGFMIPRVAAVLTETVVLLSFINTTHALSGSILFSAVQILLILPQAAFTLVIAVTAYQNPTNLAYLIINKRWMLYAAASCSVFSIMVVGGALCWFLLRNRTGNQLGDDVILRMVRHVVPSCVLVVIWQLANAAATAVPSTYYYILTATPLGILFHAIFLGTLHSRRGLNRIPRNGKQRVVDCKSGAFMGYVVSVATQVHHESQAPGRIEQELLSRLEKRFPMELEEMSFRESIGRGADVDVLDEQRAPLRTSEPFEPERRTPSLVDIELLRASIMEMKGLSSGWGANSNARYGSHPYPQAEIGGRMRAPRRQLSAEIEEVDKTAAAPDSMEERSLQADAEPSWIARIETTPVGEGTREPFGGLQRTLSSEIEEVNHDNSRTIILHPLAPS